ncbi:hypothetical protein N2152v2_001434 [Parachlorella kessleri]
MPPGAEQPSVYELQRQERIRQNQERMMQLGIMQASQALQQAMGGDKPGRRQPCTRRPKEEVCLEIRRSGRDKRLPDNFTYREEERPANREARVALRTKVKAERPLAKVRLGRVLGWHPGKGEATTTAADKAWDAAAAKATEIGSNAFAKAMSYSMVSGGFWCSAPSAISKHLGCTDRNKKDYKVDYVVGEGGLGEFPPDKDWEAVWLPHGKGTSWGWSGGWRGFSIDQDLYPGDAVVWECLPRGERVHPAKPLVRVYIYRAMDFESEASRQHIKARAAAEAVGAAAAAEEEGQEVEGDGEAATAAAAATASGAEGSNPRAVAAAEQAQQRGRKRQKVAAGEAAAVEGGAVEMSGPEEDEEEEEEGQQEELCGQSPLSKQKRQRQATLDAPCGAPAAAAAAAAAAQSRGAVAAAVTLKGGGAAVATAEGAAAAGRKRRQASEAQAHPGRDKRQRLPPGSQEAPAAATAAADGAPAAAAAPAAAGGSRSGGGTRRQRQAALPPAAAAAKTVTAAAAVRRRGGSISGCSVAGKAAAKKEGRRRVSPGPVNDAGDQFWVERIEGVRWASKARRQEYLIKWWGYDERTWEPAKNLDQPVSSYRLLKGVRLDVGPPTKPSTKAA